MKDMRFILLLGLFFLALSCQKENVVEDTLTSEEILIEQLKAFPQLDLFRSAIEACDVQVEQGYQDLSIMAPSNAVLNDLLTDFEVASFGELKQLIGPKYYRAWLASHFLPTAAKIENFRTSYVPSLALNNQAHAIHHYLEREKSIVEIDGQRLNFVQKDIHIAAGYLHIINNNIRPATLARLVKTNDQRFTILQRALQGPASSVSVILNNDSEDLSFFAPTDQAFDRFFQDNGCSDLNDFVSKKGAKALVDLLKAHILKNSYQLHELDGLSKESLLKGSYINFQLVNGNIELIRQSATAMGPFPKSAVLTGDINGFNGSLHILNEVLNLP